MGMKAAILLIAPILRISRIDVKKQPNQNGYSQKKKKSTIHFKNALEKEIVELGSKISVRI